MDPSENRIGNEPPFSPPSRTTSRTTRPRGATLSAGSSDATEAPWRRPSIRIRRQTSTPSVVTRARANSRGSRGSNERPTSGQASIPRPTSGNSNRHLSVIPEPSVTRPRAGSTSRALRHETRDLNEEVQGNRRRSSSDPQRLSWGAHDGQRRGSSHMPEISEGIISGGGSAGPQNLTVPLQQYTIPRKPVSGQDAPLSKRPSIASMAGSMMRFPTFRNSDAVVDAEEQAQYDEQMVDVLDTLDPEVSTLSTLTNVQNSLFVPDLGRLLNRRPTYTLSRLPEAETPLEGEQIGREKSEEEKNTTERRLSLTSITSRLDDEPEHYAVLPHGERLHDWTPEEIDELNDHVRHMLHSKKEKFKRGMKGFKQYCSKPLGLFVTIYATLITIFGLAWVLFLIGWISVGNRKDYLVNVIDNVLVALFAVVGDGLAPFRAVDTYHMIFIAHYHHLTWRLRREKDLAKLKDHNSLPDLTLNDPDLEGQAAAEKEEKLGQLSVLSPKQQKRLVHHQKKFSRSHTFYKPHETMTHHAFPLRLLVAAVVLLDCHSLLQIALGTCTWAISYHVRPFALTTVILCCSITCNITAGVVISVGDHKTRKKDVLERMFRQDLTAQAMRRLQRRKEKQREEEREGRLEEGIEPAEGDEDMIQEGRPVPEIRIEKDNELPPVPGVEAEKQKARVGGNL